jgi:hypothetical protein
MSCEHRFILEPVSNVRKCTKCGKVDHCHAPCDHDFAGGKICVKCRWIPALGDYEGAKGTCSGNRHETDDVPLAALYKEIRVAYQRLVEAQITGDSHKVDDTTFNLGRYVDLLPKPEPVIECLWEYTRNSNPAKPFTEAAMKAALKHYIAMGKPDLE